ncbi:glycosyltransferase family 9 protein [Fusobacterium sp. MFO224]|uniref:glycosyltransferase family 9 protein n=1 Tax=Fusobacterium sp. MFO224 TaxID=3378070 RepID=UPI0038518435
MLRELNRKIQDYMRPKRLALGKYIWDKKESNINLSQNNMIKTNNINSILFLRYDGKIGDMVVNTIFFREIKKVYPDLKIGVVSRGGATDIIKYNKNVDRIYNYSKNRLEIKKLAKEISEERYDLLIDFSEVLKVKQMMFINLCGAKINMGIDKKGWNLFDISLDKIDYNFHISKLYEDILKKLGIKNVDLSYDIQLNEEENKLKNNLNEEFVVFNPYAASKHRSFNMEKILEISKILLKKRKENLILIGTRDHMDELEKIKKKLGERVLIPSLKGILDVACVIKNSKLVITPDTSIVHIAVAFDRDIIGVYRKSIEDKNSVLWGPNSEKAKVIFVEEDVKQGQEIDINKVDIDKIRENIYATNKSKS